jgi:hypothetical protein
VSEGTVNLTRIVVEYEVPSWSAYPLTLTESCAPKGDGACDGSDEIGTVCECPCHEIANLPATVALVKDWHDRLHAGKITDFES